MTDVEFNTAFPLVQRSLRASCSTHGREGGITLALTHKGQRCYASVVEEQSGGVVLDVFPALALETMSASSYVWFLYITISTVGLG